MGTDKHERVRREPVTGMHSCVVEELHGLQALRPAGRVALDVRQQRGLNGADEPLSGAVFLRVVGRDAPVVGAELAKQALDGRVDKLGTIVRLDDARDAKQRDQREELVAELVASG